MMDDLRERTATQNMKNLEFQRYVGAHHEAAHTIARLVLDAPFHEVVLDADGLGVSRGYPEGEERPWASHWTCARVSMAGPAVEAYFASIRFGTEYTNAELFAVWRGAQLFAEEELEDDPTAVGVRSDESEAGEHAGAAYVFALALLDAHWLEIKILAAELLGKGVVGSERTSELLPSFSPNQERLSDEAEKVGDPLIREWSLYYWGR
jgi:hypothetical protein